jgi:hypothetical protein
VKQCSLDENPIGEALMLQQAGTPAGLVNAQSQNAPVF